MNSIQIELILSQYSLVRVQFSLEIKQHLLILLRLIESMFVNCSWFLRVQLKVLHKHNCLRSNDATTRNSFRSIVEPFLRDVQARRGVTNFEVVCDASNNAAVIDNNEFVADIFIQPSRSINFIRLTFTATRTGISFTESTGR